MNINPANNKIDNKQTYMDEVRATLRMLSPIKDFRKEIGLVFYASSISNLFMLAPMIYLLQIFDRVMISQSLISLGALTALLVFLYFMILRAEVIRSKLIIALGLKLDQYYSRKIYDYSFKKRLKNPSNDPFTYHDDFTAFRTWVTGQGLFGFFDLPWVPFYMFVMFILHPVLGYLSIVLIVLLIFLGYLGDVYMGRTPVEVNDEEKEINSFTYNNLRYADVSSVYNLAEKFKSRWLERKFDVLKKTNEYEKKHQAVYCVGKQLRFAMTSSALGVAAILVMLEELTLGSMIAAAMLMGRCIAPVDSISSGLNGWIPIRESISNLDTLSDEKEKKTPNVSTRKNSHEFSGKLVIDQVSVRQKTKGPLTLEKITLEVSSGEIIAVTGPSGSGKTTLLKAILGLIQVESGTIYYDDIAVDEDFIDNYLTDVGYVPQDPCIFSGLLSKNLSRMAEPDSKEVVRVARVCGIHPLILSLPQGYDTVIRNEDGLLSGGQIQRLALARALYGSPKIIIMDEPNSNLDGEGETSLMQVVSGLKKSGSTVIFTSHRKDLLQIADKIVVLNEGKIIFTGDPAAFSSYYKKGKEV